MSFSFKISHLPVAVVFSVSGTINQEDTTGDLLDALTAELDKKAKNILFDVSGLEYITSSGLNFFIKSLTKTRNADGQMIICGIHGTVEKLFRISKLNEIFTTCPTVEEGLAKINAQQA